MRLLTFFYICFVLSSCGLDKYEHSTTESVKTQADNNQSLGDRCEILELAYQSNMKPIIESRCKNCHFPGAGVFPFIPGDDATNIQTFANLLDGTPETIIKKVTAQIPHGGGKQVQKAEEKNIELFFQAKALCN